MADRLLPAVGAEVTALGVADWYGSRRRGGLLDAWIIDTKDAPSLPDIRSLGLDATATDTLMDEIDVATALAATALRLAEGPQ
jgi:LPPG:FO 2-phospho-L-lactate transferase